MSALIQIRRGNTLRANQNYYGQQLRAATKDVTTSDGRMFIGYATGGEIAHAISVEICS